MSFAVQFMHLCVTLKLFSLVYFSQVSVFFHRGPFSLANCENTSMLAEPVTNLLSLTHTDLKCF